MKSGSDEGFLGRHNLFRGLVVCGRYRTSCAEGVVLGCIPHVHKHALAQFLIIKKRAGSRGAVSCSKSHKLL